MTDNFLHRREAFVRFMKDHGLNPNKWGKLSGVPVSTIRTYVKGGRTSSLNARTEQKLAKSIGVPVYQMYGEDYDSPMVKAVWVKGIAGAGEQVTLWGEGMGAGEGYSRVPWPIGVPLTEDIIAIEIRGASMPPYNDGDLVYIEEGDALPGPDIINKLCVVELDNGDMLIKMVRRGYTPGRYNLHSFDGRPPIEDAHVIRAARVIAGTYK